MKNNNLILDMLESISQDIKKYVYIQSNLENDMEDDVADDDFKELLDIRDRIRKLANKLKNGK
jgi:protein-arginine kinase activator protein McsA